MWTAKSPGIPVQGMHMVGATDDTVIGYRIADQDAPQGPPQEVVALDADSGEELWSTPSGAQSTAVTGRTRDAVVTGSTVVTVDASNSRFEARDAHSGEVAWTAPFPAGTQCAPVPEGPRLLAMCATDAEVDALDRRSPTLRTLALDSRGAGQAHRGRRTRRAGRRRRRLPRTPLPVLRGHRARRVRRGGPRRPASGKVTYSRFDKVYDGTPGMADGTVH